LISNTRSPEVKNNTVRVDQELFVKRPTRPESSRIPGPTDRVRFRPEALARNLAHGALLELRLTPKPGLVDLRSRGSCPDLSLERMSRSASLLPAFYTELLEIHRRNRGVAACMDAGRRAEERMADAGGGAHRGYIFLSGLMLVASNRKFENLGDLRLNIAGLAQEFFHNSDRVRSLAPPLVEETDGEQARRRFALGGIRAEALAGLPSVFEVGLPALAGHVELYDDFALASHYMMAHLMQCVEDTTAVRGCGMAGLARIRHDGGILQRVIEEHGDHQRLLRQWDEEYAEIGLTMNGVADCMRLCYAAYLTLTKTLESEVGTLHAHLLRRRHAEGPSGKRAL
jgi:triphosphoribosyl-dephospho-CoA synthetase